MFYIFNTFSVKFNLLSLCNFYCSSKSIILFAIVQFSHGIFQTTFSHRLVPYHTFIGFTCKFIMCQQCNGAWTRPRLCWMILQKLFRAPPPFLFTFLETANCVSFKFDVLQIYEQLYFFFCLTGKLQNANMNNNYGLKRYIGPHSWFYFLSKSFVNKWDQVPQIHFLWRSLSEVYLENTSFDDMSLVCFCCAWS